MNSFPNEHLWLIPSSFFLCIFLYPILSYPILSYPRMVNFDDFEWEEVDENKGIALIEYLISQSSPSELRYNHLSIYLSIYLSIDTFQIADSSLSPFSLFSSLRLPYCQYLDDN